MAGDENFDELVTRHKDFTAKASDVVRQIAFAGVAMVWIFKTDIDGKVHLGRGLLLAAIFLICSLAIDLMQYVIGAAMFRHFAARKVAGDRLDEKDAAHLNWLSVFYWMKILLVVLGYEALFIHVAGLLV